MLTLRGLPFRHKLTLILTLTSGLGLLVACAAFMTYDVLSFRARMVDDLQALAEIIGDNSTAALAFNDPRAADVVLSALRAKPNIVDAYLYTPSGRIFARYQGPDAAAGLMPPPPEGAGHRFEGAHLLLFRTTFLKGDPVGTVCLRSDLREMSARLGRFGAAVALVLLASILFVLGLSSRLQSVVSRPIVDLAETARTVSVQRDYSVRAVERGTDEVAALTRAFNEMLDQIQARDNALRRAHDELEERVEQRTRQLRAEIAERRQAEEALRQSEEQLRQSQKMEAIGRLAGGIAHDFNNLLTAITGYGELLLQLIEPKSPMRRYAEEIRRASDRATALTRQLLAFGRKQLLELKIVDLNALVAGMDAMLRPVIGEDIRLVCSLEPSLGRVKADPGQIEQVILNLAVNARDAMPRGGSLTIRTANAELKGAEGWSEAAPAGSYVMLEVSDTGFGMDAETRSRVFEPFFTTKPKGKGTGLGLSMVYGIVKQSGGQILIDSAPGRGATFKILLPRSDGPVEAQAPRAPGAPAAAAHETVLLVEDEAVVRALAQDILVMNGYTVLAAAHGPEALAISERHKGPIHLMLTDVVMPYMNGRELYERLAPSRPQTKVLYMSGYADSGIVHGGAIVPGTAFIPKPFTPEALAAKVREVLGGARNN